MHPYSDLIAALYQQLSVKMFKAAYRRLNDRELAEDMVSKAFAVLLEKLLDPETRFRKKDQGDTYGWNRFFEKEK